MNYKCFIWSFIQVTLVCTFVTLVSGNAKSGDPIIIILGPAGTMGPTMLNGPDSSSSEPSSSGPTARSGFTFFRNSDKKEKKDGPHIIFIGGTATGQNNNGAGIGPGFGGPNGGPPSIIRSGQNMQEMSGNYGGGGHGGQPMSIARNGYNSGSYQMSASGPGPVVPNYPSIPYITGGYGSGYPGGSGYDFADYGTWNGWRR